MGNFADELDYALLQKDTLMQLKGALESGQQTKEYMLNLVDTAIDYNYYLRDDRGMQ